MAVDLEIEVVGLRELERNLLEIAGEFTPGTAARLLNTPLRNAARPMAAQIAATTPVDSGRLQASTAIRVGAPTARSMRGGSTAADTVRVARVGWFWRSGQGYWFEALAVEFGTRRQAAYAVLRRALQAHCRSAPVIFGMELGKSLDRYARRVARRQQRRQR